MSFQLRELVSNMNELTALEEELHEKELEDMINRSTPDGFTIHQIEELEKRKTERLEKIYTSPLNFFHKKKQAIIPVFKLSEKRKARLPEVFKKLAQKTVAQTARIAARAGIKISFSKEIADKKLHEVAKFCEDVPLIKEKIKLIPKNRLGRWINTLLALEGEKAYIMAVYMNAIEIPSPVKSEIPDCHDLTIKIKPGKTLPSILKNAAEFPLEKAEKLAAYAGIRLEYPQKLKKIKLKNICKFSDKAQYAPKFLEAIKRDVEANKTYQEIKDWLEKLSDEDKRFLLESYIKEDGIPILHAPEEITFERERPPVYEQIKGIKRWVQNGKIIFEGGVWHVPLKEAVKMLKGKIKYSAATITEQAKKTLEENLSRCYIPPQNGIPQKLLFYGFFFRNGKRKIPVGIMSCNWNKDMLFENEEIKKIIFQKQLISQQKRKQKEEEFKNYYNKACKALKENDWTAFWSVAKNSKNRLERIAYYKAKKDLKIKTETEQTI
ncbi:MAG: hypothetical protein DRP29_03585 [Thermodesulfobacteriota bacterium]|nr:MAG: hypothetical protein DRP29_03585 [Thermodesulfobacteriota bacterium]